MHEVLTLARKELRGDRHIYLMISAYVILANAILLPAGHIFASIYREYLLTLAILNILVFPGLITVGLLSRSLLDDPRHPTAWFRARCDKCRMARILAGYALLLALVPFMATFTAMKSFIGLHGFHADIPLADFDRWLHFGTDPAFLLHRILDYGTVWRLFAFFYGPGWLLWVGGFVFWMAVAAPQPRDPQAVLFWLYPCLGDARQRHCMARHQCRPALLRGGDR